MLLNCFVNLGVCPPREWLSAAEVPLMAPPPQAGSEEEEDSDDENDGEDKARPEEAAALAMLSAAWSFQVVGWYPGKCDVSHRL